MTYDQLMAHTFGSLGIDSVMIYNCFDPPYDYTHGWPLKLPDVEFGPKTLLVLHFQDFVSVGQPIKELAKVEEKYGANCNQVLVTYWSHGLEQCYQGAINLIEFSNHNLYTCEAIAQRQVEWQHHFEQPRSRAWQCLNGRTCKHRLRAVTILKNWSNGILSYGHEILLDQWDYHSYRGTENDENFVRLAPLYAQCAVNIVTETQYDDRPGIVTEKTLQAMIAGQIPIVIGHPGIVQDCQELGFDMFEDLVDISYDWLPNNIRVESALELNRELILGNIDLGPYQERLQRQKQFVLDLYPKWIRANFVRLAQSCAIKICHPLF
jgi:hypothetical protein